MLFDEAIEAEFSLTKQEKQLFLLRRFREAALAFEVYQAKGYDNLNEKAEYNMAVKRYNEANQAYGGDEPDILVLPIAEILKLYEEEQCAGVVVNCVGDYLSQSVNDSTAEASGASVKRLVPASAMLSDIGNPFDLSVNDHSIEKIAPTNEERSEAYQSLMSSLSDRIEKA